MKGLKTVYICSNCEYVSPKWLGKCPKCNSWNTFVEDVEQTAPTVAAKQRTSAIFSGDSQALPFSELSIKDMEGISDKMLSELSDRLRKLGIEFEYSNSVIKLIANISQKEKLGARAISRVISKKIESLISEKLLNETTDYLRADIINGEIILSLTDDNLEKASMLN